MPALQTPELWGDAGSEPQETAPASGTFILPVPCSFVCRDHLFSLRVRCTISPCLDLIGRTRSPALQVVPALSRHRLDFDDTDSLEVCDVGDLFRRESIRELLLVYAAALLLGVADQVAAQQNIPLNGCL